MRIGESITCDSFKIHDKLGCGNRYSSMFDRLLRECLVLGLAKCIKALIEPMNCQKMEKSSYSVLDAMVCVAYKQNLRIAYSLQSLRQMKTIQLGKPKKRSCASFVKPNVIEPWKDLHLVW